MHVALATSSGSSFELICKHLAEEPDGPHMEFFTQGHLDVMCSGRCNISGSSQQIFSQAAWLKHSVIQSISQLTEFNHKNGK